MRDTDVQAIGGSLYLLCVSLYLMYLADKTIVILLSNALPMNILYLCGIVVADTYRSWQIIPIILAHEQTEVWVEHAACPHFQRKRKLWWAEQQVVGRRIRSSLEADTSARKNSIVPIGDDALTHACACDAGKAVRGRRRRSRSRRATWPTLIFNLWRKWRRRSSKWLFNAYRVLPYVPPVSIDHHRRWWRTGDGTVVGRP